MRGPGWVPPEGNANEDRGSKKATDVGHARAEGECSRGECHRGRGYRGGGACWGARGARARDVCWDAWHRGGGAYLRAEGRGGTAGSGGRGSGAASASSAIGAVAKPGGEAEWCAGSASGMRGLRRGAKAGKGAGEHSKGGCRSDGARAMDGAGGDAERAGVAVDRMAAEEVKWAQRAHDGGGAVWTDGGAVTGGLGAVDKAGEAAEGAGEGMKGAHSAHTGGRHVTNVTCHMWAVIDGASDMMWSVMGDTRGACGDGGVQATGMEMEGPMAKGAEGVAFEDDMNRANGA